MVRLTILVLLLAVVSGFATGPMVQMSQGQINAVISAIHKKYPENFVNKEATLLYALYIQIEEKTFKFRMGLIHDGGTKECIYQGTFHGVHFIDVNIRNMVCFILE